MRCRGGVLAGSTMVWLGAQTLAAAAHPHVWINMRSDVVYDDTGKVAAINLDWSFDDAYAQMALDGLDTNGDGVYSQAELDPLTKENIISLKDYGYFVVPRVNGKQVAIGDVTEYGQIYTGSKLELHMQVPLSKPVDPRNVQFSYKVYDPEFFIAIDYVKDEPVGVVGNQPHTCAPELRPVVIDDNLDKTKQMLATKGVNWKPPDDEDFGGQFASPVLVACSK
jgi:ABC-type uncharacterized transport system substrate-binding protein